MKTKQGLGLFLSLLLATALFGCEESDKSAGPTGLTDGSGTCVDISLSKQYCGACDTARPHLDNANDSNFVGSQLEISNGQDKALFANISYGVGALSAIGDLVWMLTGGGSQGSGHANLIPLAAGAAVTWGGQF